MSNSLDPDQARHFVGPDLEPNCLQRVTADDTSRQRVNVILSPPDILLSISNRLSTFYRQENCLILPYLLQKIVLEMSVSD